MYNYIRVDPDATNFTLYPHDMLLYYDYSLVPQSDCRPYFEQLADADFNVFSLALSYKRTDLFDNARSCLGIKNTSLTEDNVSVLGNMCCTLSGSYIQNSDPSILEKLNNCPEISDAQAAAVETLLSSGNTRYGAPSTWNEQTLKDLGMFPLYLKSTFYQNFNKKTKRMFLKYFLKVLRKDKVERRKRRKMKREIRLSNRMKSKRSIGSECTVGEITQVTISDETFPFDYDDINQFNCCLTAKTVQDNLKAITDKVDQEEYLEVVLSKLQEAYAANSTIPESQVQLLGPASRLATTEYINKWEITQIDTLAALMDSSDGAWDPNLAKEIITKYLSTEGNTLGSAELNAIGGPNLCSLDSDVVKNISQQSLGDADALIVSNCTKQKKQDLFPIARQAFSGDTRTAISVSSYQLIQPYMGGAPSDFVKSLVAANVSMDLATFTSLDEDIVLNLTVSEVQGLLGNNLADLKAYENQTLVQNWIIRTPQTELDTLGIGLKGGRADPTTAPASNATTTSASNATTASNSSVTAINPAAPTAATVASSSTTTGNGNRIRADAGFSLLVLLALLITSQHAIM
uniref:Mesothelin-like protein n=1 Tax=Acanthochromis polyacanthus TaxID=80966 RepID=A0A3Q1EDG4_9TELE